MLGALGRQAYDAAKKAVQAGAEMAVKVAEEVQGESEHDPLASLVEAEELLIEQRVDKLESVLGAAATAVGAGLLGILGEEANQYWVYDKAEKKLKVVETSEKCGGFDKTWVCCCTGRKCCAPFHKLQLHVFRPGYFSNKQVILIDRPFKGPGCCCACCECCLQEATVYAADETGGITMDEAHKIGLVKQPTLGGCFAPKLDVMDRQQNAVATVSGPTCCVGGFCCDSTFTVQDANGTNIGTIVNKRPTDDEGWARELLTDADRYTVSFPKDADPKSKALLLGALFLLDYMIFENGGALDFNLAKCSCVIKCCDLYCCGCLCPCKCDCSCSDCTDGGDE